MTDATIYALIGIAAAALVAWAVHRSNKGKTGGGGGGGAGGREDPHHPRDKH